MKKQNNANDLDLKIDVITLKPLFKTDPLRHALAIAGNWTIILFGIYGNIEYFHPLLSGF